jgi:hypothetical protein
MKNLPRAALTGRPLEPASSQYHLGLVFSYFHLAVAVNANVPVLLEAFPPDTVGGVHKADFQFNLFD